MTWESEDWVFFGTLGGLVLLAFSFITWALLHDDGTVCVHWGEQYWDYNLKSYQRDCLERVKVRND